MLWLALLALFHIYFFLVLAFSPSLFQMDDLLFLFISSCCSLCVRLFPSPPLSPGLKVTQSSIRSCVFGDTGAAVAAL